MKFLETKLLASIAAVAHLFMLIMNILANAIPIGGQNTGQISASYPSLFTPAGITFSIWGLIYVLLTYYIVMIVLGAFKKEKPQNYPNQLFILLLTLTSILNGLWIVFWHLDLIFLSLLIIVGMLGCLAIMVLKLKSPSYAYGHIILSIYFGWITIATIANVTILLVSVEWGGFGISDILWTSLILDIGAIIGLYVSYKLRNNYYLGVFIWAYLGILFEHVSASGRNGEYPFIVGLLIVLIVIFVGMMGYQIFQTFRKKPKEIEEA